MSDYEPMNRDPVLLGGLAVLAAVGLVVALQLAAGVVAMLSVVIPPERGGYHFYCLPEEDPSDEPVAFRSIPPEDRAVVRDAINGETRFVNESRADSLVEYGTIERNDETYQCYVGAT